VTSRAPRASKSEFAALPLLARTAPPPAACTCGALALVISTHAISDRPMFLSWRQKANQIALPRH
jgi:hypothetical protein